jgi:hypothetical protein
MMEAVRSSETSVSIYQTIQRNISEDSHLHNRCRENLKSHHGHDSLNEYFGVIKSCLCEI